MLVEESGTRRLVIYAEVCASSSRQIQLVYKSGKF